MNLDLLLQISKLLRPSGDLTRGVNTALLLLQDSLNLRNTMLLVRDCVTNKYFIELAPELKEEEKSYWNQQLAERSSVVRFTLHYETIMSPADLENFPLPSFSNLEGVDPAIVLMPLYGQDRSLPVGLLYVWFQDRDRFNERRKVLQLISEIMAMSLEAHGSYTDNIYHVSTESVPMVLDGVVAVSGEMKKVAETVKKVARSRATILVRGESGTGKELIAKAIHQNSIRHNAPFISINCAALSDNLLESELFGHEKGAFTGAIRARQGRFELADGGTLFLDEIGDTSLEFQTKLLRVLQEGQFERLGSSQTLRVDVRLVCATNVDLEMSMRQGMFREDLFYRLNVVPLHIPPLRDRQEDIVSLVEYFLDQLNQEYDKNVRVTTRDIEVLKNHAWPGNVRELENSLHSAFLMENDGQLDMKVFDHFSSKPIASEPSSPTMSQSFQPSVKDEEVLAIQRALEQAKGVQSHAAKYLKISLRQLRYRIKKYQIPVRKIRF